MAEISIQNPLSSGIELINTVVSRIWPDKTEEEKAQFAAAFQAIQGQLDINKQEAISTNWFVAGWRPFIGWICGVGLGYQFLIFPLLHGYVQGMLPLDMGTLITLLGGMLGMGGLRTYEKVTNSEGNR